MTKPTLYHEQPNVVIPRKFINDNTAYANALEAFVLVCTDCLLINREKGTVYLAKRRAKPMSCEWWFIGGRVFAGEDELSSMLRCIKRETGLAVEKDRLDFLAMKRYFFKNRQQDPQEKGCDSLCYIFSLEVTEAELSIVRSNLDENEYDLVAGLQEFDPAKLVAENVFPSIIDVYERAFPGIVIDRSPRLTEVEEWALISEGGSDPLKYDQVQIVGKDLPMKFLRERIPQNKLEKVKDISDNYGLSPKNISGWSKIARLLNKTIGVFHHDSRFFGVFHYYYTVYPDGTVEEGGYTQIGGKKNDVLPDKPRRPVNSSEDRYA